MNRIPQAPQLNLAQTQFARPLFVDMESFFDFSFQIAEDLLNLEAAYSHKHSGRLAKMNPPRHKNDLDETDSFESPAWL